MIAAAEAAANALVREDDIEARLLGSLELLDDTLQFLLRLPATAPTLTLARRIRDQLRDPRTVIARERLAEQETRNRGISGAIYNSAGIPVCVMSVIGDKGRCRVTDYHYPSQKERRQYRYEVVMEPFRK